MIDYNYGKFSGGFSTNYPIWTGSGGWKNWWEKKKEEKRYKSSLGYSSSSFYDYSSGSYYGTYKATFTNPEDSIAVEKLLTSSYKAVREAVVILDFPFKVDICFSGKTFLSKKNNIRKIFLPTKSLDDKDRSDADKIDVLCGNGIHEAAHLKYTEIRVLESLKYNKSIPNKQLTTLLSNVIEDERVEDKLLKERPGYESYLTKKKTFDLGKLNKNSYSDSNIKLLDKIIKFIRYRSEFKIEEVDEKFIYLFSEVDKQLQEGIYNSEHTTNTKSSCTIASTLAQFIIDSLINNHGVSNTDIKLLLDWILKNENLFYDVALSGRDCESDDFSGDELRAQQTSLVTDSMIRYHENLANGKYIREDKTIFISDIKGVAEIYQDIKNEISPLIAPLKRILVSQDKNYDFIIHGCRSGILDTTKLAEAYQGVPQVYTRVGHVRTNKAAICILVDESGSMRGSSFGSKWTVARKTAILFNEAFGNIPGVDLFIYGHTADEMKSQETTMRIYREPGWKADKYIGLTKISARVENRDGDAILSAAKRVKKLTNSNSCTMFVISDGEPSAVNYQGFSAIEDTREKIVKVQQMGFEVIGICIDSVSSMKFMYDSFIDISSDLSKFPSRLGEIVKKAIMKNKTTVTT